MGATRARYVAVATLVNERARQLFAGSAALTLEFKTPASTMN